MMPRAIALFLGVLLAAGVGFGPVATAQPAKKQSPAQASEPAAEELLRKMSLKLAGAKQFTLTGRRTMDAAMAQDRPVSPSITCELALQRPNRLLVRMEGNATTRTFYFDGTRVTLYDRALNAYASVQSIGSIDTMLDNLQEKYGFTPPLTDFLVRNPYASLTRNVRSSRVEGREEVEGKECHHLVFNQEQVDWELWLATDDLLPRKFVLIQKAMPNQPRLEAVITKWDLAPQLDAGAFTFKPPKGAEKIEMMPLEERGAAKKKGQGKDQKKGK